MTLTATVNDRRQNNKTGKVCLLRQRHEHYGRPTSPPTSQQMLLWSETILVSRQETNTVGTKTKNSLSFRFDGHFPGEPGSVGTRTRVLKILSWNCLKTKTHLKSLSYNIVYHSHIVDQRRANIVWVMNWTWQTERKATDNMSGANSASKWRIHLKD